MDRENMHLRREFFALLALVRVWLARGARTAAYYHDGDDFDLEFDSAPSALSFDDDILTFRPEDEKRNFVSSALGSDMVLQRDRPSTIWGFSVPGVTVTTTFENETLTPTVGGDGVWRQILPSRPASLAPTSIRVSAASTGESAELTNVLFGDVYFCGGQSNMQFAMPGETDAAAEAAAADSYPHVRLFTVGLGTKSPDVALDDLQSIWQPWEVASSSAVAKYDENRTTDPSFGMFSAVCWIFGRTVADGLDNKIPIGLISNNWGGTTVEQWSTQDALDECYGSKPVPSSPNRRPRELYNSMIHPYTVGPMAISGFTWYQGEANVGDQASADLYACSFPAMIRAWRKVMEVPDAYFGFVQLSTWCAGSGVAELREAQMAALHLPGNKVGYATNADVGAGCNIHPPFKRPCGVRLGRSALALNYGRDDIAWRSPTYSGATTEMIPAAGDGEKKARATVTVELKDVSDQGLILRDPYNRAAGGVDCGTQARNRPDVCAWASIRLSVDGWVNATATLSDDGRKVVLVSNVLSHYRGGEYQQQDILESSYGWGSVPMLSVYDAGTGLPVLPWKRIVRKGTRSQNSIQSRGKALRIGMGRAEITPGMSILAS